MTGAHLRFLPVCVLIRQLRSRGWLPPKPPIPRLIGFLPARDPFQDVALEADALHSLLVLRADHLAQCDRSRRSIV
jgi:hypothetical protein